MPQRIAIAGVTGYIGGRLLRAWSKQATPFDVLCARQTTFEAASESKDPASNSGRRIWLTRSLSKQTSVIVKRPFTASTR